MMAEKNISCCFPLETKARDLDPRLYLGLQCIKEGYSCLIGGKGGVTQGMFEQNMPFIFFDKGLNALAEDFYRRIKSSGGAVVSLDEEGGVYNDKLYRKELLRRNKENVLKFVDLIFTWGSKQRDILVENTTFPKDKVIVSGHPRFDLCKPKFKTYQTAMRKSRMDIKGKYVLINSTFTAANTYLSFEEEVKFRIKARGDNSLDVEYERLLYCYRKLLINYFYEAIKQICAQFPDLTIVFRPHPGENIEYYEGLFADMKNVVVTCEGSVQEWISDARMVFHHDCTSAIEAFLNEKFIISYCRIKDDDYVQAVPIKISHVVSQQDDLFAIVKNNINTKNLSYEERQRKEASGLIRPIIANVDFEASSVIVEALKNIRIDQAEVISKPTQAVSPGLVLRKGRSKAQRFVKGIFNINDQTQGRLKSKFPGLTIDEVKMRVDLFKEIDKNIPEINIKKISEDTYLLISS